MRLSWESFKKSVLLLFGECEIQLSPGINAHAIIDKLNNTINDHRYIFFLHFLYIYNCRAKRHTAI